MVVLPVVPVMPIWSRSLGRVAVDAGGELAQHGRAGRRRPGPAGRSPRRGRRPPGRSGSPPRRRLGGLGDEVGAVDVRAGQRGVQVTGADPRESWVMPVTSPRTSGRHAPALSATSGRAAAAGLLEGRIVVLSGLTVLCVMPLFVMPLMASGLAGRQSTGNLGRRGRPRRRDLWVCRAKFITFLVDRRSTSPPK